MVKKIINFWNDYLWNVSINDIEGVKSFGLRFLRCISLSFRGFREDSCRLKASALTFYTLLSVVPVLAMAFGVAKGFGVETILKEELMKNLPGQEEILQEMIAYAHTLLENTAGGLLAGIGIALLFWTVIKLLGNIEHSFNEIWGVKKQRNLGRKFSDYLSVMLLCPFLFIISSSLMVLINSQVSVLLERFEFINYFGYYIKSLLKLSSFGILWMIFCFIYIFMPNTKVHALNALIGGFLAAFLYQVAQHVYINFQIGVSQYNAIYGSFAVLPLFLIWLQISWYIVLFGSEVAFAAQNMNMYEFEVQCKNISRRKKEAVILSMLAFLYENEGEDRNITSEQLAKDMNLPIRLVRDVVDELIRARLIVEIIDENDVIGHKVACSLGDMKLSDVFTKIHTSGINDSFEAQNITPYAEVVNSFYARVHATDKKIKNILHDIDEKNL